MPPRNPQPWLPPEHDTRPPGGLSYRAPDRNTLGWRADSWTARFRDLSGAPGVVKTSYWLFVGGQLFTLGLALVLLIFLSIKYSEHAGELLGGSAGPLIGSLIWTCAVVFCAIRFKEGAPWARTALTVVGILSLFGLIGSLQTANPSGLGAAASVVATILAWLPASRTYLGR